MVGFRSIHVSEGYIRRSAGRRCGSARGLLETQEDAGGRAAGGAGDTGGVERDLAAVGVQGDAGKFVVGLEIDDHPAGVLFERQVDDAFDDGLTGVEEGKGRVAAEAAAVAGRAGPGEQRMAQGGADRGTQASRSAADAPSTRACCAASLRTASSAASSGTSASTACTSAPKRTPDGRAALP